MFSLRKCHQCAMLDATTMWIYMGILRCHFHILRVLSQAIHRVVWGPISLIALFCNRNSHCVKNVIHAPGCVDFMCGYIWELGRFFHINFGCATFCGIVFWAEIRSIIFGVKHTVCKNVIHAPCPSEPYGDIYRVRNLHCNNIREALLDRSVFWGDKKIKYI